MTMKELILDDLDSVYRLTSWRYINLILFISYFQPSERGAMAHPGSSLNPPLVISAFGLTVLLTL